MPLLLEIYQSLPLALPVQVEMAIDTSQVPAGWPAMEKPMVSDTATRVMIITRGTRGDVQPFIALARCVARPSLFHQATAGL